VYGEVTYAVRDTSLNGMDIKEGDIIALINGKISLQGSSIESVVLDSLGKMRAQDGELITLFYGLEVKEEDALHMKAKIMADFPDSEIEMHFGGQPHYHYLLSVE